MSIHDVSIVGGGLCGLTLALFLKREGVKCTIYELRKPGVTSAGAIMLSPNALRSLDAIGLYDRIKSQGYEFRDLVFRNNEHKFLDAYEMGNSDKYGYDALRVYRHVVLDELKAMVSEAGIETVYEKRFSHVVEETNDSVTFAFADGEKVTTALLIGADGIHSTVREYIVPNVKPVFNNIMALTCAIPTTKIKFPFEPYPTPVSIHGEAGAFVLAAQNTEGSEMLGGIQYRTHDRTRAEWDALWHDKEQLLAMIKQSYDRWSPMVQSAMDAIPLESISIWAFYSVPPLESWKSDKRRVVLGINQGIEDVHALSLLVAAAKSEDDWKAHLDRWQLFRSQRVERVTDLTNEMSQRRLPGWTGEGTKTIDSSWLFDVEIGKEVLKYLEKKHVV